MNMIDLATQCNYMLTTNETVINLDAIVLEEANSTIKSTTNINNLIKQI